MGILLCFLSCALVSGDVAPPSEVRPILTAAGSPRAANAVAFLRNSTLLAFGGNMEVDNLFLMDVSTGERAARFWSRDLAVESLVCSPDGRTLFCANREGTVQIWSLAARELVGVLRGHNETLSALAISPNGKVLAAAGQPKVGRGDSSVIDLWDTATQKEVGRLVDDDWGLCLAFSPDGKTLVSRNNPAQLDTVPELRAWDVATGKSTLRKKMDWRGDRGAMHSLCFSPDGKMLAPFSLDDTPK